ncbi:heliorhodopsin HeR [Candidatus Microgenomates bacterium]|nr:heliorhodopsin HeR [Candidatus Microgenomates bacterium]
MAKTITYKGLRKLNLFMGLLHLAQGLLILAISTNFKLPVIARYLDFDAASQSLVPASHTLFNLPLAWLIAAFFFLSGLAHLFIATLWRQRYQANLRKGMNPARWVEYALSASTMMVAIGLLVGIYEASLLISIFALTAIMNLMGLVMEVHNQTTQRTSWLSYLIGCFAGLIPWIAIGLYFWAGAAFGSSQPPTFVYWIFVSIFVFFNIFALNMWLQYKQVGKWANYLYGERAYIILSLVAKSALAWQIFAGTLRPL